jgi:hypothetical protein
MLVVFHAVVVEKEEKILIKTRDPYYWIPMRLG